MFTFEDLENGQNIWKKNPGKDLECFPSEIVGTLIR